eukprot:gnl/Carplike_NY0171/1858_a2524_635.p1 GENE.gnl/Carplike_NY0171/1858_a2524_635~~gnl/Carplike_NY0171/1858_a2524_635.p1  ORF type:complete len:451 (+),score=108.39 gnl/Carplike_NY0171/1858_a2524_635:162-1514(+)
MIHTLLSPVPQEDSPIGWDGDVELDLQKIVTSRGKLSVEVYKSKGFDDSLRSDLRDCHHIICVHGVFLNHRTTWGPLLFHPKLGEILFKHFIVVGINMPYHEPGAREVDTDTYFPDFTQLSTLVIEVANKLKIDKFIGFGCGAGAAVMHRTSSLFSNRVSRILLIDTPVVSEMGAGELMKRFTAWKMGTLPSTEKRVEKILNYLFSAYTLDNNHTLVSSIRRHLKGLPYHNQALYLQAFAKRKAFDPDVACPVLDIRGDSKSASYPMMHGLRNELISFILVDGAGTLPQIEKPDFIAAPVMSFIGFPTEAMRVWDTLKIAEMDRVHIAPGSLGLIWHPMPKVEEPIIFPEPEEVEMKTASSGEKGVEIIEEESEEDMKEKKEKEQEAELEQHEEEKTFMTVQEEEEEESEIVKAEEEEESWEIIEVSPSPAQKGIAKKLSKKQKQEGAGI